MINIYKEVNTLVEKLKHTGYPQFAKSIHEAKLSGSFASEILGFVMLELDKASEIIEPSDENLRLEIENLSKEIKKVAGFR